MSDSVREVTSVSWFGRIKRSFGGLVGGLLLIVFMVVLLFWNEGRAVVTAKSLAEGASTVVAVAADRVDPANDGRLVHVSGPVTTDTVPADPDFGISRQGIRLVRTVEMYQWKEKATSETTKKLGGGEETVTTYSYSRDWEDDPVDSGGFKQPAGHANPPMEIRGRQFQVPSARLEAFTLDQPVLSRITGSEPLPVGADQLPAVEAAYGGTQKVSVVDGRIYLPWNPTSPAVGDYRISYAYAPLGPVSIVARQAGSGFEPYQTVAGNQLLMVRAGAVAADKMFADAVSENSLITWILRVVGLVVLFIAFALVLSPVGVLADVIPALGVIVRMGTGLVAFLLAVLVGTATIAVAWFWYRPLLSLALMAAGVLVAFGLGALGRSRAASGAAGPARSPVPQPAAPQPEAPARQQAPAPSAPPRPSSKWN